MDPEEVLASVWCQGLSSKLSVIDAYFTKLTCKRLCATVGDVNDFFFPKLRETLEAQLEVPRPVAEAVMMSFRPGCAVIAGDLVLQAILGEAWKATADVFVYMPPDHPAPPGAPIVINHRPLPEAVREWKRALSDADKDHMMNFLGDLPAPLPPDEHGPCAHAGDKRYRADDPLSPRPCRAQGWGLCAHALEGANVACMSGGERVYQYGSHGSSSTSLHVLMYKYRWGKATLKIQKAGFVSFSGVSAESRGQRDILERVVDCVAFDPCASVWDGKRLIMYDPVCIAKRWLFHRSLDPASSRKSRAITHCHIEFYIKQLNFTARAPP